jgi:hypothetical protein
MGQGFQAHLRRLWKRLDTPFGLPATTSGDEGTWFELRPNGVRSVGIANPPRFADQSSAEEAARQLKERRPAFEFVEVITYETRDGRRGDVAVVSRV